jgi:hypothetical protein
MVLWTAMDSIRAARLADGLEVCPTLEARLPLTLK